MPEYDLLIVGAGPVGLALALGLRDAGLSVVLADSRPRGAVTEDPRMLALSHGTRLTLERLGVWSALRPTPIERIEVSQQGALGRSEILAGDYQVPALGYVLRAGELAAALDAAVAAAGIPVLERHTVTALTPEGEGIVAQLDGTTPQLRARLAACAEGSVQGPGKVVERDYAQHAVIGLVRPAGEHARTAHERFTAHGPVALLPAGRDYAVVHTATPEEARALVALDDASYLARLQTIVGPRIPLREAGPRLCYPLGLRYRPDPVGTRCVWLGNAAQTLHPVAGQGFNLALRDVWALVTTLQRRADFDPNGNPGSPSVLARYRAARRVDRRATIGFTDTLVRLFSNDLAPLRHLRGAGLCLLEALPPLRHFVAKRMMFGARAWP